MAASRSRIKRVARVARDRNVIFQAASIAYYAFVSLIPLALSILVVGAVVNSVPGGRIRLSR